MGRGGKVTNRANEEINPGRDPWERMDGESAIAFNYFVMYLHLGPYRNIPKLAEKVDVGCSILRHYSSDYDWADRAARYDDMIHGVSFEKLKDSVALRKCKYITTLDDMISKGAEALKTEEIPSFTEAKNMIIEGIKTSQLILGEATERVESSESIDLSGLSDEELLELKELNRKAFGESSD